MDTFFVKFIGLIILIWVASLAVYFWKNDFAKESIDIFFPTLGAILLSLFLAVKTIWVEAPKEKKHHATIIVLHDWETGTLYSPYRINTDDPMPSPITRSRGLSEVETLAHMTAFKNIDFAQLLVGKNQAEAIERTEPILLEGLEFILWDWIASNHVPSWLNDDRTTVGITNSSGASQARVSPGMEAKIKIDSNTLRNNRLIALNPINIKLPNGSIVTQIVQPITRKAVIETNYSVLTFEISLVGGGVFDSSINALTRQIAAQWGIQNKSTIHSYNFEAKWTYKVKPFSRYAKQAKLEEEWADKLYARFNQSFAWEIFRERLLKRASGTF